MVDPNGGREVIQNASVSDKLLALTFLLFALGIIAGTMPGGNLVALGTWLLLLGGAALVVGAGFVCVGK